MLWLKFLVMNKTLLSPHLHDFSSTIAHSLLIGLVSIGGPTMLGYDILSTWFGIGSLRIFESPI